MKKYRVVLTKKFRNNLEIAKKRGLCIELLYEIVDKLQRGLPLKFKNRDHKLKGSHSGYRECHIQPDWLLVYKKDENELILTLIDTGAHSDIFN